MEDQGCLWHWNTTAIGMLWADTQAWMQSVTRRLNTRPGRSGPVVGRWGVERQGNSWLRVGWSWASQRFVHCPLLQCCRQMRATPAPGGAVGLVKVLLHSKCLEPRSWTDAWLRTRDSDGGSEEGSYRLQGEGSLEGQLPASAFILFRDPWDGKLGLEMTIC